MPFKLLEHDERILVGLDYVVGLFEADSDLATRRSRCAALSIVHRHGGIVRRPLEVLVRLAVIHILVDVKHDNVVVHFHLECDTVCNRLVRSTEDEFDLNVLRRAAGPRVDWLCVLGPSQANVIATFGLSRDGEDADKDGDGFQ